MRLGKYLRNPALIVKKLRWQMLYAGPRRDVTVDSYNGRLTFDSRDKLIGKYLYIHRAYERRYIEGALDLLEREGYVARDGRRDGTGGGTLLDVGANIGMICIALLKHGWFERAVAFEPAPENLRRLEHNVAQNGYANRIIRLPYALSSANGTRELELSEFNSGDNRIRHASAPGAWHEDRRQVAQVQVRTLDDALAEAGVDARDVRLAWVDIQGHEGWFLQGARATLGRGVPVVSEFWPYGILRSGMTRDDYGRVVADLFTHVYHLHDEGAEKLSIEKIDTLFDRYRAPKAMCEVIFVREP
jgi:FkbM family methyltransferase